MKQPAQKALLIFALAVWLVFLTSSGEVQEEPNKNGNQKNSAESNRPDENKGPAPPTGKQLGDNLRIERWATNPMLKSPVAIDVDPEGRVFVSSTVRRRHSAIPIRDHMSWRLDDLSFRSVEDRRQHHRAKLAPEHSESNSSWLTDYNNDGSHDWRDLTVQSDKIYLLEDTDEDGKADQSKVFAEGFNTEVSGVAAGVHWYDDHLYATVVPDLWKLKDKNGDGKADERRSISQGYGVHMGFSGHNMHGPITGPDGRIYWSIGDIGLNVTGPEGKQWAYPHEGAVMRCEPDGTDFEVFARGLRNPQEIAFDRFGNLFTVDNNSDGGDKSRIEYILRGSDSGWRIYWQYDMNDWNVWLEEKLHRKHFREQPSYVLPPVAHYSSGPAGFVYNPGTAVNRALKGHFFLSDFTGSRSNASVTAFRLKPDGAGFAMDSTKKVAEGVLPTGLAIGPEGALYIADWIKGWVPHDEGAVWRITPSPEGNPPGRKKTHTLLTEGLESKSVSTLGKLLGHPDMRVRKRAQFELVSRGNQGKSVLLDAARNAEGVLPRIHGIWGMGQLARDQSDRAAALVPLLNDDSAEVRAQAVKVIGDAEYELDPNKLISLLDDPSPRVRAFASSAAGRLELAPAFRPLVEMLAENDGDDPHLQHAGIMGLTGTASPEQLAGLANHESTEVRLSAIVALRRKSDPAVSAFLKDDSVRVLAETARAIHDDTSIPQALDDLAAVLERTDLLSDGSLSMNREALFRRAINANLRLGGAEQARRLAGFAANRSAPSEMRAEALRSLAVWNDPPHADRVEGRYRTLENRNPAPDAVRDALTGTLTSLIEDGPKTVRTEAVRTAGELKITSAERSLFELVTESKGTAKRRVAALQALEALPSERLLQAVGAALNDGSEEVRTKARKLMASVEGSMKEAVSNLKNTISSGTTNERQASLRILGNMEHPDARRVLADYMEKLVSGNVPPPLRLDLLEAARKADKRVDGDDRISRLLEQYRRSLPDDPLAEWTVCLQGGDAEAGKAIVEEHGAAQCLRCHRIDGEGGKAGPDLSSAGVNRSRRHLLESLIRPNAQIAEGFSMETVTLEDGSTVGGTVTRETEKHIVLETPAGETRKVEKTNVRNRTRSDVSAMPSMEGILTKKQIRDVVEYLSTRSGTK